MLGDVYCHVVEVPVAQKHEALAWLREQKIHCMPRNVYGREFVSWGLREPSDAMMFKLMFGGK